MAELGQTTDPRALIPGNPETVVGNADALRATGDRYGAVGEDLHGIDIPTWIGAASDSFRYRYSHDVPKWFKVGDALSAAATALAGHAEVLTWAQSQAALAIELWERGEAATRQAAAEHSAAAENAAAGAGGATLGVAPFVDPGGQLRQEARDLLTRARQQLLETGGQAASTIGTALDEMVDAVTGGRTSTASAEAGVLDAGVEATALENRKLTELKAFAHLANAKAEYEFRDGVFAASGKAEAFVGAEATMTTGLSGEGLHVNAEAVAGAKASAEQTVGVGPVGAYGKVEGFAGARVDTGVVAGKEGVAVHAGAFAGARASAEGSADVAGIGVGVKGEAWAGAGVEADIGFSEDKEGNWHIGGEFGIGLGVGGKVGTGMTVDPGKVVDTAQDAADFVGDSASATKDLTGKIPGTPW